MTTSANHGPRDDLVRFVQDTMHEQGLSLRRMSVRAIDPENGHRLGFQWLGKLAAGGLSKAPDPWQLRALAAALGVPGEVVKGLAARQWLEYEVAQVALGSKEWALYLQLRELPDGDKETLRILVHEFVRRQEEREKGESAGDAHA
jgi:hypothetical protein